MTREKRFIRCRTPDFPSADSAVLFFGAGRRRSSHALFLRPFPPSAFGGATRRWIHRIFHALQTRIVNTVYSIIIRESCLRAVPDSSSVATTMKKRAGTNPRPFVSFIFQKATSNPAARVINPTRASGTRILPSASARYPKTTTSPSTRRRSNTWTA